MRVAHALAAEFAAQQRDFPLLRMVDVAKRFGATHALDGASVDVRRGEVHVLLGENGAGKSTLAKVLAGIYCADTGAIYFEGNPVQITDVRGARSLGIGMIFQELSLAPHLTVVENLFLGRERSRNLFSLLNRHAERSLAIAVLRRLQIEFPLETVVSSLTIAQKQMIEIAKVLVHEPKFIIMDEPTSTLTVREKDRLFDIIHSLRRNGVSILYVTHHLREVIEIGDTVSAMRDGKVVMTRGVTPDLTEPDLLKLLTGREFSDAQVRKSHDQRETLLEVVGLGTATGCKDVNFTVAYGEIVGIYGVIGCGRENVGRVLVGVERRKTGDIMLGGRRFNPRHPAHARKLGVGYLPMDRKEKGILPSRSIRENLNLSNLHALSTSGIFVASGRERMQTSAGLKELLVRYRSPEDLIVNLSGGNQQKVLLGRAVRGRPQLLILEDPTAGIDVGAKRDIHKLSRQLADEGLSILVFSSDLVETLTLCDRIYAMYSGGITDHTAAPTLSDEGRVLSAVLGHEVGNPAG